MAYKYLVYKDYKRRFFALRAEKKRNWLKSIIKNFFLNYNIRLIAKNRLTKEKKNHSFTRIKNRCVLTGNPKSVYRKFKMCRMQLKTLCTKGLF
jgi:small subunit ribosomal protein S14